MSRQTILIAEDEEGIRNMVKRYLEKNGFHVLTAENGEHALEKVSCSQPHLILLDIEMPGIDGFEVCRAIREKMSVPIIFLTVRKGTIDKVKCFELGGDDYITKPFEFTELKARINAKIRLYHTNPSIHASILKYDGLEIHLNSYTCYLNGKPLDLSTKEMALLIHLAKHPQRVWSHEQLYDQIWSMDATGNIETVKVHISTLRRKIEVDQANPTFIKTIRGFGYIFAG